MELLAVIGGIAMAIVMGRYFLKELLETVRMLRAEWNKKGRGKR